MVKDLYVVWLNLPKPYIVLLNLLLYRMYSFMLQDWNIQNTKKVIIWSIYI